MNFELMNECFALVCHDRLKVADGMERLIERLGAEDKVWLAALSLDWAREAAAYVERFVALANERPIPGEIESIWFEIPDDANPAASLMNAYAVLGPAEWEYGLDDDDPIWPEEEPDYSELHPGLVELPVLEQAIANAGYRELAPASDEADRMQGAVWALSAAYAAMLAMEAVEKADLANVVQHESGIAVLAGFASGDVKPVGQFSRNGWGDVREVEAED